MKVISDECDACRPSHFHTAHLLFVHPTEKIHFLHAMNSQGSCCEIVDCAPRAGKARFTYYFSFEQSHSTSVSSELWTRTEVVENKPKIVGII